VPAPMLSRMSPLHAVLGIPLLLCVSSTAPRGEELPKGPPWHVTYRAAMQDAIEHRRPVYVYFTKTY